MTRGQLYLAAALWSDALIAHTEQAGEEGSADKVRVLASKLARRRLIKRGVDRPEILNERDAIDIAKRMRPSPPPK